MTSTYISFRWNRIIVGWFFIAILSEFITCLGNELISDNTNYFLGKWTLSSVISLLISTVFELIAFLILLLTTVSFVLKQGISLRKGYIVSTLIVGFFTIIVPTFIHGVNIPSSILGRVSEPPFEDEILILWAFNALLWIISVSLFWLTTLRNNISLVSAS